LPVGRFCGTSLEHSTLHRGQIVGMIRMLGHAPPAIHRLDFELAGFG
jgi:uncharacterized damage-inducible protein DinB